MRPIIGITANYSTNDSFGISEGIGAIKQEWQLLADDYVYSIEAAGGTPVILPVLKDLDQLSDLIKHLDGIIFTGGKDIDPNYYGQYPTKALGLLIPERDRFEIELAKIVLSESNIPVLGICRGCQLLTVATGGTLFQDMQYQKSTLFNHACTNSPKHYPIHNAQVDTHSLIYDIFNTDQIRVNSFHHQAIDQLGKGFKVTMSADDNTVEAIEMPPERYVVGIQWHPEMMTREHPYYLKIFTDFVKRCSK
ncbi:gamma-glutamyl-gamma-aminobutyrate hydrolase family protein [Fusibacter ferrireducens]|uniref:Gamma-glutamyl-gamma-aminobutyrate hydrolase family protein n=1 Tax=Fusibacter ferrireducens TaxID=2785058 RepID=A0ABR9ZSH8_9FIRM|nr:gamma-glutamyl-gamma-aminobutyrate hydrolase family protein [Fusibacter ferrireducens]MBF4693407.1 gamma-glutamyl-gamma-aminobutyrate hydrolase family protein [Fusibacter ferrireducens]